MSESDSTSDATASESEVDNEGEIRLYARNKFELLELPLKYRWEFTRRHPYYLRFWQLARGNNSIGDENQLPIDVQCARLIPGVDYYH